MRKIGILTFHDALNVGAVLQAYALQTYLENLEYSTEFINYSCRPKFSLKRLIGKNFVNTYNKLKDFLNYSFYGAGNRYNRILKVSRNKYSNTTIGLTNLIYDTFIVGSDQVWNFSRKINDKYLLSFVNTDKKKIAYAASMGQCDVPKHLHAELLSHIKSFESISCREFEAVDFLTRLTGNTKQISQCSDPTLLINKNEYSKICVSSILERYIVSYILNRLDAHQCSEIELFCNKKKLNLINLRNPDTCIRLGFAKNKIVYPEQWLGYVRNADYVICGSFHATVFSLIFHKKFIVFESEEIYSHGGNQRVRSLLRPLGLEYRCISHGEIEPIIEEDIDWNHVDEMITKASELSKQFLIKSLGQ